MGGGVTGALKRSICGMGWVMSTIFILMTFERSFEPIITQGRVTRDLTKAMRKRSNMPLLIW